MTKNRLEAFSDGVMAIIITIMVLELKVPHVPDLHALLDLWPVFLCYVMSFVYIGIYWNNHHHLFHTVHGITAGIMWTNMHLLFWLSMVPFCTAWMGENHFAALPTATYGVVLFLCGLAYTFLSKAIIRREGKDSLLARAVGSDRKGIASQVCYLVAVPLAFVHPAISGALYVGVALLWIIPDRRIERVLDKE
ncbi:MAG: TMEM175 family protein [Flavobacteriales bacterium]